jgi:hypothetical protein
MTVLGRGHNNFQNLHTIFILLLFQYNAVLKNVAFAIQHIYFYGSYGLVREEMIWDDQYTDGQARRGKNLILDRRCWC